MRLMFVGDLSMGEHFFSFGHGPRSLVENGENPLKYCTSLFQSADLVIGNLEGPISDYEFDSDDPLSRVFRGAENSAAMLKDAGISVVNIANNHSMQHGIECFHKSIKLLEESGLLVIGKSRQLEPWTIKVVNGKRVGFIAASDIDEPFYRPDGYRRFSIDEIIDDIKLLRVLCDFLIVSLHWGLEGVLKQDEQMVSLSELMFSSGADVIVGHHSHIFSPIQVKSGKLVAYGLGDFIFDLPWSKQLNRTAVLDVNVDEGNKISAASCWPVHISNNGIAKPFLADISVFKNEGMIEDIDFDLFRYKRLDRYLSLRKFLYFLIMLPFGATRVKLNFLKWKVREKVKHLRQLLFEKTINL